MRRDYHSWEAPYHPDNQAEATFKLKCINIIIPGRQHTTLISRLKTTVKLRCTDIIIPGRLHTTLITRLRTTLKLKCIGIIIPGRQHTTLMTSLMTTFKMKCTVVIVPGRQQTTLITRFEQKASLYHASSTDAHTMTIWRVFRQNRYEACNHTCRNEPTPRWMPWGPQCTYKGHRLDSNGYDN